MFELRNLRLFLAKVSVVSYGLHCNSARFAKKKHFFHTFPDAGGWTLYSINARQFNQFLRAKVKMIAGEGLEPGKAVGDTDEVTADGTGESDSTCGSHQTTRQQVYHNNSQSQKKR